MILRIWVWRDHTVDPDEGAHLMDGALALRGLVPFVDFQPRQFVYTYVLAAFIRLVGRDYSRVRLCMVFVGPFVATFIFLIARRLFDARVGLLAAATYLLFPLVVESAPSVHMEPFAMLAACGVAYCLVRHLQSCERWGPLLAAGILIAVGIYVHESAIAIGFSAVLTLTLWTWRTPGLLLRRYAVLAAGFLIPCALLGLGYSRFLSPAQWWRSPLNPLYVLVRHWHGITTLAAHASGAPQVRSVGALSLHPQVWSTTSHVLRQAGIAYGGLLTALAISIVMVMARIRDRRESARWQLAGAVLYPWALSLALAYGYWAVYRGFFAEYAEELLPPLAIIFGFVVVDLGRRLGLAQPSDWATPALAAAAVTIFVAAGFGAIHLPGFLGLAIVPLILGRPWIARKGSSGWWSAAALAVLVLPLGLPASVGRVFKVMAVAALIVAGWAATRTRQASGQPRPSLVGYLAVVLLGAGVGVSFDAMGQPGGLRPGGVWLPSAVQQIADTLRGRGQGTDEVMSGGVIWEFQAGLQPFARITHPLKFEFGIAPGEAAALTERLQQRPPKFVIFDGYTERTYGAVLPALACIVADRYELVVTVPGGGFPVRLYELRRDRGNAVRGLGLGVELPGSGR